VAPLRTTTYELTALGRGGDLIKQQLVIVVRWERPRCLRGRTFPRIGGLSVRQHQPAVKITNWQSLYSPWRSTPSPFDRLCSALSPLRPNWCVTAPR